MSNSSNSTRNGSTANSSGNFNQRGAKTPTFRRPTPPPPPTPKNTK